MSENQRQHDLHMMLGEIASDVKHILLQQTNQSERIEHLSRRVATLERGKAHVYGALAVIPTVFTVAIAWLKYTS